MVKPSDAEAKLAQITKRVLATPPMPKRAKKPSTQGASKRQRGEDRGGHGAAQHRRENTTKRMTRREIAVMNAKIDETAKIRSPRPTPSPTEMTVGPITKEPLV